MWQNSCSAEIRAVNLQQETHKVGRPKTAENVAKRRIVPVRFNVLDLEEIKEAAKISNNSVSAWIRNAAKSATKERLGKKRPTLRQERASKPSASESRTFM
jgi:hypothetical protein